VEGAVRARTKRRFRSRTIPGDPSEWFPCLVDLRQITAVDQDWATDVTYIPLQRGFFYLVAFMDLHSRH